MFAGRARREQEQEQPHVYSGGQHQQHPHHQQQHYQGSAAAQDDSNSGDVLGPLAHPPPSPHVRYLLPDGVDEEDLRLRIVRTPTESLHEVAREDERRRVGKRKRRGTFKRLPFGGGNNNHANNSANATSKLARGLSIASFKSSIGPPIPTTSHDGHARPGTAGSTYAKDGPPSAIANAIGMGLHGMNGLGQQIQQHHQQHNTRTADEEQEANAERFAAPTPLPDSGDDDNEAITTAGGSRKSKKQHKRNASLIGASGSSSGKFSFSSLFTSSGSKARAAESRRRRNVYLNLDLPLSELDKHGQPRSYARNKVRTSKYTIWTFIPKNLTEQFKRVANLYFLGLIILQIFPIFGGAAPMVAMLPLLAILIITAVKDGIEDWRRQQLDESVNTSAVTRLRDWRNVNVPTGPSGFFSRMFSSGNSSSSSSSGKVSKGVRKLREREGALNTNFLYQGGAQEHHHSSVDLDPISMQYGNANASSATLFKQNSNNLNNDLEILDTRRSTTSGSPYQLSSLPMHQADSTSSSNKNSENHRARSGSMAARSYATSRQTIQKQGVVDYDRQSPGTAKWERTLWKKLEVGDVVLLREDDQVPADIVVLSTSDAEGQCFVETKNLDGETNLKPRRALKATRCIQHEEDVEHAQFVIDSEPPHANLYSYNGVLRYTEKEETTGKEHPITDGAQRRQSSEKQEAITINELLLRGCAIRNTTWIIGMIVYTGEDTKIMLNQGETPSKRSKIEKETNFNVFANFVILVAMCLACGIANGIFLNEDHNSARYYEKGVNPAANNVINAVVTFGACLIVFQNIVPISLIITIELVKTIQAIFIYQDIDMWYEPLDHPCVPKTWNISDDLGQIEYIFSDKTGTLTQNVMEFKKCSIGGVAYGEGVTEAMLGAAKGEGKDTSAFDPAQNEASLELLKKEMIQSMKQMFKNKYLREDKLTFIAPKAIEDLGDRSSPQRQNIIQFFRALAVCHTVLGDKFDPENQNLIDYKAESPDEAALVAAARDAGFAFLQRSNQEIEIEVMGQTERYQPLRVLEFNSSRKRMSVVVRQPDGRLLMICKGADSVIYARLKADHDPFLKTQTEKDMEEFANAGLRTLCISYRYIEEEEFANWATIYDAACAATQDREDQIEKACELIEHDLTIMGATALEDKLQVGVPDAIAQLHKAGIKLWILTGDKVQTAIEIGFSCNLLTSSMDIMIISSDTEAGARAQIEAGLDKINKARAKLEVAPSDGFAVVIDGDTLRFALDPSLKPLFLEFTTQCSAVVCCRVSPSQKALTVKLVKDGKKAMTLAIGDGANDVAMIQEAHVGIGIAGLEGAQASMSADYAIGQFRFLTKLLLVHGRWCYIRVAEMHANFFYKNIVWVFTMFWYQFFCNFDANLFYDYSLVLLYNVVFTSLPVIIMGAFDQDVNAKLSLAYPQLYKRGIQGLEYSRTVFWTYMLDGLYQSAVCFFFPYIVWWYGQSGSSQGYTTASGVELGTTVAASAVVTVTLFVGLNNSYHTALMIAVLVISALLLYIWVAIYSAFPFSFNYLVVMLFSTVDFWALLILTQVLALGPRFVFKYIRRTYSPTDNDIIREIEVLKTPKHERFGSNDTEQFGEKHRNQTPAPHLEVRIVETPLPFATGNDRQQRLQSPHQQEQQQMEMREFGNRRASLPLDGGAQTVLVDTSAQDSAGLYDTRFSPPPPQQSPASPVRRQQIAHSAIPMGAAAKNRSRNPYSGHAHTRSDAYEELDSAKGVAPPQPDFDAGRLRQDSSTPFSPSTYDAAVGSPPISPYGVAGHMQSPSGASALTRGNSQASYATALSEPDYVRHSDEFSGYAR